MLKINDPTNTTTIRSISAKSLITLAEITAIEVVTAGIHMTTVVCCITLIYICNEKDNKYLGKNETRKNKLK